MGWLPCGRNKEDRKRDGNHYQANVSNTVNNLSNTVTADEDTALKLTTANNFLTDQIKLDLAQNKVLNLFLQQNLGSNNNTKKKENPTKCTRSALHIDNLEKNWGLIG